MTGTDLTTGGVAQRAGESVRTLYHYDSIGLLNRGMHPARRRAWQSCWARRASRWKRIWGLRSSMPARDGLQIAGGGFRYPSAVKRA